MKIRTFYKHRRTGSAFSGRLPIGHSVDSHGGAYTNICQCCTDFPLFFDKPLRNPGHHLLLDTVETVICHGETVIPLTSAACKSNQLLPGSSSQFFHEGGDISRVAVFASIFLMMHDQNRNPDALYLHFRHRPLFRISQNRGRQDQPVRPAVFARQLGGSKGCRLRAPAGADQPYR